MPNDQLESQSGDAHLAQSDRRLAGKTAFITGAARRVGAAIARTLHAAGANTVLHYRSSSEDAIELARELNAVRPGSAAVVSGDLLDIDKLPALAAAATQAFGGLDILVNNASSFYPTPVGDISEIDWDDLIGTNLKAPLFLSQAAAPALHANQGLVLNLADIHGMRPLRRHPVYSVAKAGLIMLTKSLARELGPLAALAPELIHPTEKVTIGELWQRFDRSAHALIEIEPSTNLHSGLHRSPGSVP